MFSGMVLWFSPSVWCGLVLSALCVCVVVLCAVWCGGYVPVGGGAVGGVRQ